MRDLLQDFQPHGALAGHDVHVVEGVDEDGAGLVGVALGFGQCLIHVVPVQDDFGAVAAGGGQFGQSHAQRHVDARFDSQALRRHGDALGVIAGRGRDDPALFLLSRELGHAHIGTADLEGTCPLEVFALEEDLSAHHAAQCPRRFHRCPRNNPLKQLLRLQDIVQRDGQAIEGFHELFSFGEFGWGIRAGMSGGSTRMTVRRLCRGPDSHREGRHP